MAPMDTHSLQYQVGGKDITSVTFSSTLLIYSVVNVLESSTAISESMHQCNALRLSTRWAKQTNTLLARQRQYSSSSPVKTNIAADHFIKTGEKPQDPADSVGRSDEYSQSGGDDMVAQQGGASFDNTTGNDMQTQKDRAGKGNVVNPLELSPATSELSHIMSEEYTSKSEKRKMGDVSGHHSGRKTKSVVKTKIDFK